MRPNDENAGTAERIYDKKLLPVDFTMNEFKAMTAQQLKLRLKEFGVSTPGKKTDLVER